SDRQKTPCTPSVEGWEATSKIQQPDEVAYGFESRSPHSMRMAVDLLQRGYRVETSNDMFRAAGEDFPRGSFILRAERNPADLSRVLARFAGQYGISVKPISSALSDDNDPGIGSERLFSLEVPKVAILAGEPGNQTSYGLLRFLLQQQCGLELVPVPLSELTL